MNIVGYLSGKQDILMGSRLDLGITRGESWFRNRRGPLYRDSVVIFEVVGYSLVEVV